jgi:peptidyl-prolyl cis-trans isomerase C
MNRRTWLAAAGTAILGTWTGSATAQSPAALPANVVAVVNGATITRAELDAVLKMSGPSAVVQTEAQRKQRQMEVLSMLIDNLLMRQFLEKHTSPIAPAEVARRLAEMENGLKSQGKSLPEFCHDTNQTMDQLRASIVDHMRWSAYAQQHITEVVTARYHQDHKDFFDKVTVKASHIVLRVPPGTSAAEKQKAQQKLLEIRAKLLTDPKTDFAEMARLHSHDPQASKGGDLGWFPRKWVFDESFSRATFALQPGQISNVVETDYGLHLIKVAERKPGEPSEYAKIKEAVREFCAEDVRQQILTRERKAATIRIQLP